MQNDLPHKAAMDCETNPTASLKKMFIDSTMGNRIMAGQCPVRRAVFLKPHGVAKADFIMVPGLPEQYKVGIFAHERFSAWVRFSSDTQPHAPDMKSTVGIGIKLFDVPGEKLLESSKHATTADFLLQNMNVFFVDNATEMCKFTKAGVVDHNYDLYLKDHPETQKILDEMAKTVDSCLTTPYWSGLPYAFGDRFVKYKLEPIGPPFGVPPSQNTSDYLQADLQARLNMGEAQFNFMVQFQTNPETMPLDKAMTPWSETESKPVHIATLVIQKQDITNQGQAEYGENLSFNPWRTLKVHEPQGSISAARKVVYEAGAELRRFKNGVPAIEPNTPRPLNLK
ncbi:hypothetical protein E6C50_15865 [Flavobacterium supellecticarium]|uniref:Catalase n=1 Tax=Flavobacterium supellecticarium TaxID=2565924 RepID=A0A4S3ZQR4_9FLAO|nr:hypothetical protein [Flavobacterium supellecticarium]THF47908.1 hypothetical protein E6C50_15865 [Flavobacterium supellecticarium]